MHYSLTSDWIGRKLDVNPEEIMLFIEADFPGYVKTPRELKVTVADSVEYIHPRLGRIIFGPKQIRAGEKVVINAGYESQEFRNFIARGKSGFIKKI